MKRISYFIAAAIVMLSTATISCNNDGLDPKPNYDVLKKLYTTYKDGEISIGKYNNEVVYVAGINAFDAGSVIYDKNGDKIGECNFAWGSVSPICGKITDQEVVYRCKNHITGMPPADRFGLTWIYN
jgi:hypothetical protein